jgi:glycerol kinase
VQWLRDELKIIDNAADTEDMAKSLNSNRGVYLVPAFTGLGAPYWDPDARGAIFGITRDTGRADFVRAALESVCYQTHDLLSAMSDDGAAPDTLRVDGGMVANDWVVQFLSDILDIQVDRPEVMETTALGAAYLAGLQAGLYNDLNDVRDNWRRQAGFTPNMNNDTRSRLLKGWAEAVDKVSTT